MSDAEFPSRYVALMLVGIQLSVVGAAVETLVLFLYLGPILTFAGAGYTIAGRE